MTRSAATTAFDPHPFLHGHCAAFAIAAARALSAAGHAHVGISILIDECGEPNSDDGRCVCHAYASTDEFDLDAAGVRDPGDMASDMDADCYDVDGPFSEAEFLSGFCGEEALIADQSMIDVATHILATHAAFQAVIRGPSKAA